MIIKTAIEYDSVMALGQFLKSIGMTQGSKLIVNVARRYGDEFERCDYCDFPHNQCTCDSDGDHRRRYDMYDDEASF